MSAPVVLVLGGYGNFGRVIAARLAKDRSCRVVIAGRDAQAAARAAQALNAEHAVVDVTDAALADRIHESGARVVVHTAGPFQGQDYRVARAAIDAGAHYVDIADGREFVCGIGILDAAAKARDVLVVSGASSVPALSSAVVDSLCGEFARIHEIEVGITTSAKVPGRSTVKGVLAYCGKPFAQWRNGRWDVAHGWQHIRRHDFGPQTGERWTCDCDVPDLALFPGRYGVRDSVRFHAGVELAIAQWGVWAFSWIVRARLIRDASAVAGWLRGRAIALERFGSGRSAMRVTMMGIDNEGRGIERSWGLEAARDDGASIPCLAAVVLARKLLAGAVDARGALPCAGLVSLDEYLAEARDLDVRAAMLSSSK